jgi:cobalt-zinc-cadmium efflux system membrane fusion protein
MNIRNSDSKALSPSQALSLLILLGLLGCKHEETKVADAPPSKVEGETVTFVTNAPQLSAIEAQTAEPRKLSITHLTGRLYWNEETTVRVFTPVAGRVISVLADLGQPIAQGAPLAEIDSPDFNQALSNARTAEGNLAMADKAFARSKQLLEHGAAAQKDVEAAEAAFIGAQAERDRAEAVLANYGGSLHATNLLYLLHSPLAGDLVEKNINPGQELRADLMLANAPNLFVPLFVVSDPTTLWLQLDVTEPDLTVLQPGQELQVHCLAFPGKVFAGTVGNIGATMDSSTRTLKVRGIVRNPEKLLRAEMYVSADVVEDTARMAQAGVVIPSKAIFMKGEDAYLFIERSAGQYQRQRVKIGIEQDGKVPVLEGVVAGQKVVTEGALLLQAVLENDNS